MTDPVETPSDVDKLASLSALITANAQLYGQQAVIIQGLMNRIKQLSDLVRAQEQALKHAEAQLVDQQQINLNFARRLQTLEAWLGNGAGVRLQ